MMLNTTIRTMVVSAGLMAGILPGTARAGWFDFLGKDKGEPEVSTNVVKRFHLAIADKTAEKELLQITGVKHILLQEKQVLMLLVDEKRKALSDLDGELTKVFGIKPDKNYRYDAKTLTLAEVPDKTASAAKDSPWKKKLDSESESRKFAALASAKQVTQEDLVVLLRLVREKENSIGRVETLLRDKFSMSRDRNYWYDAKAMRLYEIVPSSKKGAVQ